MLDTNTIIYIIGGILIVVILIVVVAYFVHHKKKEGIIMLGGRVYQGNVDRNRYYGLEGAPWYSHADISASPADTTVGYGWGGWQVPYRNSWWTSAYDWYSEPKYSYDKIKINTFNGCNQMCVDNYKTCVDSNKSKLECVPSYESCMSSCPVMDYAALGH